MNKREFKKELAGATGCRIQHNGWPCGTCFYSLSDKLDNKDWQTVLLYRGDYKEEDLNNLPPKSKRKAILEKIYKICKGVK